MDNIDISLGISLGLLAGFMLGTFALPMKRIKNWHWEHTWIMYSFWGTIIFPLVMVIITVPNLWLVFAQTPSKVLLVVFTFGAAWGIANIAYGVGLKMVGLAMGTAIVLGLNNAIGAILPIILYSPQVLLKPIGIKIVVAVIIMITGVVFCAVAGLNSERPVEQKKNLNSKKDYFKGIVICLIAGVFGAMFNFALINGKPIEMIAINLGSNPLQSSNPIWVVALSGGFVVTLSYCIYLFVKRKNFSVFFLPKSGINWIFTLIMGLMWYGGVALYGMSVTRLGVLGASIGWPLIQSMAMASGSFWGIVTGEWRNYNKITLRNMIIGLGLLIGGIVIIGFAAS